MNKTIYILLILLTLTGCSGKAASNDDPKSFDNVTDKTVTSSTTTETAVSVKTTSKNITTMEVSVTETSTKINSVTSNKTNSDSEALYITEYNLEPSEDFIVGVCLKSQFVSSPHKGYFLLYNGNIYSFDEIDMDKDSLYESISECYKSNENIKYLCNSRETAKDFYSSVCSAVYDADNYESTASPEGYLFRYIGFRETVNGDIQELDCTSNKDEYCRTAVNLLKNTLQPHLF